MANILVIEDNPMILNLITYLLTSSGHQVVTAENGAEGMERALEQTPDLILCDLWMKVMDGFAVGAQLKEHPILSEVPLVAVTLYTSDGDKERILDMGFNGYIPKPISAKTFVQEIEAYLVSREEAGE